MTQTFRLLLATALVFDASVRLAAQSVTAERVNKAIEGGIEYLLNQQNADGSWPDERMMSSGVTSLCALALLSCGIPHDDPRLAKSIDHLRQKGTLSYTYTVALQTMVFCAADPQRDLLLIKRNVAWLEGAQMRGRPGASGAWSYTNEPVNVDNSNAQFALLALHEAERVGVTVSAPTWRLANDYWRNGQNQDGSWGYHNGEQGTGSMTSAGIAALVIAADKLDDVDASIDAEGNVVCCGALTSDRHLENGLQWMSRHFDPRHNPGFPLRQDHFFYYIYGAERAGRLANRRFFGEHDWYREGSEALLARQDQILHYWQGDSVGETNQNVATALALLFLSKGRRPVLASKLRHPGDDWNLHRHDLANLTTFVEQEWKRELSWQVIDPRHATKDDLSQTPVLFITGRETPQFTDEQISTMREYINQGGFILAEAACGEGDFDHGFRELIDEKMFPEPEYRLTPLGPEHPIWGAELRVDPEFAAEHPLYGVDVGCRTVIAYCPRDLGCYWELARVGREDRLPAKARREFEAARAMGINILAYATNRELKYKLDVPPELAAGQKTDPFDRARLYVAKIKHGGGWNVAPAALPTLLSTVAHHTGLRTSMEQRETSLASPQLFEYPLVFMDGRTDFRLTPEERKNLRAFVLRGGVVLADSVCASEAFSAAFRREMAETFPEHPLAPIPVDDAMLTDAYGGFNLKTVQRRSPGARRAGEPLAASVRVAPPQLEGVRVDDRYGVVFSPYDLSCALERQSSLECEGYLREDAAKIGLNVILYALQE